MSALKNQQTSKQNRENGRTVIMNDILQVPTISGLPDNSTHPWTYTGDSGYRSRASSRSFDVRNPNYRPHYEDIGDCPEHSRKPTQLAVFREDTTSRYKCAVGDGPQKQRPAPDQYTKVATRRPDGTPTVSGRVFHEDNCNFIGDGSMGQSIDSGFLSCSQELKEDCDAEGSADRLYNTTAGHFHSRQGPRSVGNRCKVGEKSEPYPRGAYGGFTEGSQFPNSKPPDLNRGNSKSSPSLATPDSMRCKYRAEFDSHDQFDLSRVPSSERDVRSSASGPHRMTSYRSDCSVDSALARSSSLQSIPSLSSELAGGVSLNTIRFLENPREVSTTTCGSTPQISSVPDIPLDKLFIRRMLSVAGLCIPSPVAVKPDNKWELNPSPSYDEYLAAPQVPLACVPRSVDLWQPDPVHSTDNATFERQDVLEAFHRACKVASLRGISTVGRVIQIANFAGAMLDRQGGYLSIDALDVHLYVPCGAVPDGPPQLVYIFVEGNLRSSSGDQLTPCVHCGPSTLRFRKDVILTFPHCAMDATDHRFTFTKSKSGGYVRVIQDGEDGVIHVDHHSITMTMDHFCGYSACAPVSARRIFVCVFINENLEVGRATIRLRLMDEIEANVQEAKISEAKHDFFLADPIQSIEVHRTGGDVQGILTLLSKSWEITCSRQTLRLPNLWHGCSPATPSSRLFQANRKSQTQVRESFEASMKVSQAHDGEDDGVELHVKMPPRPMPYMRWSNEMLCQYMIEKLSTDQQRANRNKHIPLTEGINRRLCDELDMESAVPHDWHYLPENLPGLKDRGSHWVKNIDSRAKREHRSPCEMVLDEFFAQCKRSHKGKAETLQDLKCGLLKLERQDLQFAIGAIDKLLGDDAGDLNNNSTARDRCGGLCTDALKSRSEPSLHTLDSGGQPCKRSVSDSSQESSPMSKDSDYYSSNNDIAVHSTSYSGSYGAVLQKLAGQGLSTPL